MSRVLAALAGAALACAGSTSTAHWPGWANVDRGALHFEAPADLIVEDLGEGRLRLERPGGWPLMEARMSVYCPDSPNPGVHASEPGRFASPLGGLPLGEERFYSIVADADRCVLLRFFGLWDAHERNVADQIAATVRWNDHTQPSARPK